MQSRLNSQIPTPNSQLLVRILIVERQPVVTGPGQTARAGGNLYQITDGVNGLLYTVSDSRDLAAKLSRYLLDPDLRREHGKTGRAGLERQHDMKQIISKLLNIYSDRPDVQAKSESN